MAISRDTIKAMIRDYHGFDLTDTEIDLIQPELDNYAQEIENLRNLDLSALMSSRLLRVEERGASNG